MKTLLKILFLILLLNHAKANKFFPTKGSDGGIYLTGNNYDTVVFTQNFDYAYCHTSGSSTHTVVFINQGLISSKHGFEFDGCSYIKLTGTGPGATTVTNQHGTWTFGFWVHDGSGQGFNIHGKSNHIEVEHMGIQRMDYFAWIKQEVDCDLTLNYPNTPMHDIIIHDNYCKGAQQDGFYVGSTAPTGGRTVQCGEVNYINITNQGNNYTNATVTFTGGKPIIPATATATITNGHITAVNLTYPGQGYQNDPNIQITGDGSGATAIDTIKFFNKTDYIPGRLYNIAFYNNYLDSLGRTGCQFSGVNTATADFFGGKNVVFNNIIKNAGWEFNNTQGAGIFLGGMASNFKVYNNTIDSTWSHAIFSYGVDTSDIFNNNLNHTGFLYGDSCERNNKGQCTVSHIGEHQNFWQGTIYMNKPGSVPKSTATFRIINNVCGVNTDPDNYKVYVGATSSNTTYSTTGNIICNNGKAGADAGVKYSTSCTVTNQPPIVNAGPNDSITSPILSYKFNGSTAIDNDGTISTYAWTEVSGPSYSIDNAGSLHATVSNLIAGNTYVFKLTATDNGGASSSDNMQLKVITAPNQPPIVDAGPSDVTTSTSYSFTNSTASDPENGSLTYLWTKKSGPTFAIDNAGLLHATVSSLIPGNTYVFTLKVTDNAGAFTTDDITIVVNNLPNNPPVVNAGSDVTMQLPKNFFTADADTSDTDGKVISLLWTKISGPSQYIISNASILDPTFSNLTAGTYQFSLKATDDDGASNTDVITVIVNPASNQPPVIDCGPDGNITLPINYFNPSATASDPEGGSLTYLWQKVSGPTSYTITNPTIINPTIASLVSGTYLFSCTVTDNAGAIDIDQLTIIVNSAQNQSPSAVAGNDRTIQLPQDTIRLAGSGVDVDGTVSSHIWSIISGSGVIADVNSYTSTVTGLTTGQTFIKLTVTDNGGLTDDDTLIVTVNPSSNTKPTANAGNDDSIQLPTNVYQLNGSGNDVDGTIVTYKWRKVSSSSNYAFDVTNIPNPMLLFSAAGTYQVSLTVTDNAGATSNRDTVSILVKPSPINIAPTANAGNDFTIALSDAPVALNGGSSFDIDGTIVSYLWEQVSGDPVTIKNETTPTPIVTGMVLGDYTFELTVTDNEGASNTDTVTVHVISVPNFMNKIRKSIKL